MIKYLYSIFGKETETMRNSIMKRAAALLAVLAAAAPVSAGAENDTRALPNIEIMKGDEVTVAVYANADGYSGLHLQFDYDKTALTYKSQNTVIGHGDAYDKDGVLNWNVMFSADGSDLTYNDKIAELTFIANSDITTGVISVSVAESYGEGGENGDFKDIDFMKYGRIKLTSENVAGTIGDIDDNGTVDSADALAILRASANIESIPFPKSNAADVNHDGVIDSADTLLTLRHSVSLDTPEADFGAPCYYTRSEADVYFGGQG